MRLKKQIKVNLAFWENKKKWINEYNRKTWATFYNRSVETLYFCRSWRLTQFNYGNIYYHLGLWGKSSYYVGLTRVTTSHYKTWKN